MSKEKRNEDELIASILDSMSMTVDEFNNNKDDLIRGIHEDIHLVEYGDVNRLTQRLARPEKFTEVLVVYLTTKYGVIGFINFCISLSFLTKKYKNTAVFDSIDGPVKISDVILYDLMGSMEGPQTANNLLSLSTVKISLSGYMVGLRYRFGKRSASKWVVDYSEFLRLYPHTDAKEHYRNMISHLYVCFPSAGHVTGLSQNERQAWVSWIYCLTEVAIEKSTETKKPKHKESTILSRASIKMITLSATTEANELWNSSVDDVVLQLQASKSSSKK